MESLEKFSKIEKEKPEYTSKIKLSFFRHAEKEKDKSKSDLKIRLTEEGRKNSKKKSDTLNIRQSVVFGSPRERAQETASFRMSGNQEEITGEETFEELKDKLNKGLKVGSKISVDKRLDSDLDMESDFGKISLENFKKGQYLKFLVEESDSLAKEKDDTKGFTYLKSASNVAKIIEKYLSISKRWDKLVQDPQKNYDDTLERYFGTHLSVGECFLAKAIEETEGEEKRDEFVKALNNQGFDFNEGFEIEILNSENEPSVHISFKKELSDKEEGKEEVKNVFEFDQNLSIDTIKKIAESNQ
ncbi:MAG: histidine phosphatase family protein [Patescibacteria group bacterium]|nr:histidine phosphatase family protein [Patescibacteria group bacterium]